MLNRQEPMESRESYISVRKKHVFFGLLFFIAIAALAIQYLISRGLYIGFTPAPTQAEPLSKELVERLNLLDDKLSQAIQDINEISIYKDQLEKAKHPSDTPDPKAPGQGGMLLAPDKINAINEQQISALSFQSFEQAITQINLALPLLKKDLLDALLLKSNLPDGVPLAGAYAISSLFGFRDDPFTHQKAFHSGVDFAADEGTPVLAAATGRVQKVNTQADLSDGGLSIEITHPKGVVTRYDHLSAIRVTENQLVQKGDLIGLVGNTGRSTGPHLHFEVLVSGLAVDPMNNLSSLAVKPPASALAAFKSETTSKCAALLLIVQDKEAKIYRDCLADQGADANALLISKQMELSKESRFNRPDKNTLKDECVAIDTYGRLKVDANGSCGVD